MSDQTRHHVILWLSVCSVMIFAMVLLGGAVRLTGSGLSMVDWKPIMGGFTSNVRAKLAGRIFPISKISRISADQ